MKFPSKEIVERLRQEYPVGTEIELVKMNDKFAPPIGTKGVVQGVDDAGSILVKWSNGSSLSLLYNEDVCRKLNEKTGVK